MKLIYFCYFFLNQSINLLNALLSFKFKAHTYLKYAYKLNLNLIFFIRNSMIIII